MKPAPLDMDYETSPPPLYSEVCILHIRQSDVVLVLRLAYCHLNHALLPMSLNVVPNLNLYIQISLADKQQGICRRILVCGYKITIPSYSSQIPPPHRHHKKNCSFSGGGREFKAGGTVVHCLVCTLSVKILPINSVTGFS